MKESIENFIHQDFPFVKTYLNCDDGWFVLIYVVLYFIKKIVGEEKIENFQIIQIKEKFGGLRIHTNISNIRINNLIWKAETASYNLCEICGQIGELRKVGYLKTLCDECIKKRK
jgi:hypothetical protein